MATCSKCGGLIPYGASACPFCGLDGNGVDQREQTVSRVKVGPVHPGGWDGIAQPPRHDPSNDDYTTAAGFGMLVLGFVQAVFWVMFAALLGVTAWQLLGKSLNAASHHHTAGSLSLLDIMRQNGTLPASVGMIVRYGSFIVFGIVALLILLILIGNIRILCFRVSSWYSQWRRLALAFGTLLIGRLGLLAVILAMADRSMLILPASVASIIVLLICTVICGSMLRNYQYT